MKAIRVLAILATAFLTACVTTGEPATPVGAEVEGVYRPVNGRMAIPLPEGKWTVAGRTSRRNNIGTRLEDVVLVQEQDGIVKAIVDISTPEHYASGGYQTSKFCARKDIHHIVNKGNYGGREQNCWGVNHRRMTLTGNVSAEWEQARSHAMRKGLKWPINMLSTEYRVADPGYYLNVIYFFNPESEGFEPPRNAEWATSDWHRDRVHEDQRKVEYVARIRQWGEEMAPKVAAGFKGQ